MTKSRPWRCEQIPDDAPRRRQSTASNIFTVIVVPFSRLSEANAHHTINDAPKNSPGCADSPGRLLTELSGVCVCVFESLLVGLICVCVCTYACVCVCVFDRYIVFGI